MGKRITTLYVDEGYLETAKQLGINLSEEFNKFLMISIGEAKRPKELPIEVTKEIDRFVDMIKASKLMEEKWRGVLIGRCRLIKSITGFEISPVQLEEETLKRLQ